MLKIFLREAFKGTNKGETSPFLRVRGRQGNMVDKFMINVNTYPIQQLKIIITYRRNIPAS